MCNGLKNGSSVCDIPQYGFGYKVFRLGRKGTKTLRSYVANTRVLKNEWIKWNPKKAYWQDDGFCFLLEKEAVWDFIRYWDGYDNARIYRIKYRKGLGQRMEGYVYMSSLCKEFKILQEVNIKDLK